MRWIDDALDRLAQRPCCGYQPASAPAVEPTALVAMALWLYGRAEPARNALRWLTSIQSADGSLGVDAANKKPCWPTGWAVLAWRMAAEATSSADRAVEWILALRARPLPRTWVFGHDTQLQAWPWVEGTHSWVEPTAINLMALKASGQGAHPRAREAVAMLLDRQLPSGGWNFGNTVVLGNTLRPHIQPTGLALAALAGEPSAQDACQRSLDYLQQNLSERTTTASLCYGLLGAAAHKGRPAQADAWLEAAFRRTLLGDGSAYRIALCLLAANQSSCPWRVFCETTP